MSVLVEQDQCLANVIASNANYFGQYYESITLINTRRYYFPFYVFLSDQICSMAIMSMIPVSLTKKNKLFTLKLVL